MYVQNHWLLQKITHLTERLGNRVSQNNKIYIFGTPYWVISSIVEITGKKIIGLLIREVNSMPSLWRDRNTKAGITKPPSQNSTGVFVNLKFLNMRFRDSRLCIPITPQTRHGINFSITRVVWKRSSPQFWNKNLIFKWEWLTL